MTALILISKSDVTNIKIFCLKNKFYFIFGNKDYCLIPKDFSFSYFKTQLFFVCKNILLKKKFLNFIALFKILIKKSNTLFVKKIIFKGLGLKANLSADSKVLDLKLGYSHLIKILIDVTKINVKLTKNAIVFSSSNLIFLGNFLYKIRSFKKPNIYKGKGIWYKNEKIKLKTIKKN